MLVVSADNGDLMLLRGIFGVLFGLIALFMPGPTLAAGDLGSLCLRRRHAGPRPGNHA